MYNPDIFLHVDSIHLFCVMYGCGLVLTRLRVGVVCIAFYALALAPPCIVTPAMANIHHYNFVRNSSEHIYNCVSVYKLIPLDKLQADFFFPTAFYGQLYQKIL